jgi:hypothetical protein
MLFIVMHQLHSRIVFSKLGDREAMIIPPHISLIPQLLYLQSDLISCDTSNLYIRRGLSVPHYNYFAFLTYII